MRRIHENPLIAYLGGTLTRKKIRFNTFVCRKDKWGVIVKIINLTS